MVGRYPEREEEKSRRDYVDRAFTVGSGGPVGSGKTALVLSLCRAMREKYGLVVVSNNGGGEGASPSLCSSSARACIEHVQRWCDAFAICCMCRCVSL